MLIQSQFKPAWWLNNPHLQTIYPNFFRKVPFLSGIKRERITLVDGDFVDLDWYGPDRGPLVILLHGLGGSSRSQYIVGLQVAFYKLGWQSMVLNFRGCSGEFNRTARCYHSGETQDLDFVYHLIQSRINDRPIALVGFSLGGNMLLKWLGEQSKPIPARAAVAVSVPLVLNHCAAKLDEGFSRIYREYLLKDLKSYIVKKQRHLQQIQAYEEAKKLQHLGNLHRIHSFWRYDDAVIAKLYGFRDVHDYYQQSSSRQYLKSISIPTLLIQAADDPFMTRSVLPSLSELGPKMSLELSSSGGHVGFVGGQHPIRPEYWLERRIPAFLHQVM